MNRIILLGRLVRDPEVKVTSTQKTYCTFTLAVDRPFIAKSGQREADFIPIQTWNKTAEICGNSLSKGQRLLVEGRLQIRSYDGKDGKSITRRKSLRTAWNSSNGRALEAPPIVTRSRPETGRQRSPRALKAWETL